MNNSMALAIPGQASTGSLNRAPEDAHDMILTDLDAEEVGKVVGQLQEEIKIIKLQLENLPGYEKGKCRVVADTV